MTVCERVLRNFKFELPGTSVTELNIDENLLNNTSKVLEKYKKKGLEMSASKVSRELKVFASEFHRQHGVKIKFSEDAVAAVSEKAMSNGTSPLNECNSLFKDLKLLKSQAERCKDILLSLSKNPHLLKDNFFEKIKIADLIKLNFEKFNSKKKLVVNFEKTNSDIAIIYKDEINYALSNILQNAIQHAKKEVSVTIMKNLDEFSIKISDDGKGFSREIFDKLGEPYISKSSKGMGLGIFIAKNLIENVDGRIVFYNSLKGKAVVEIFIKGSILKS